MNKKSLIRLLSAAISMAAVAFTLSACSGDSGGGSGNWCLQQAGGMSTCTDVPTLALAGVTCAQLQGTLVEDCSSYGIEYCLESTYNICQPTQKGMCALTGGELVSAEKCYDVINGKGGGSSDSGEEPSSSSDENGGSGENVSSSANEEPALSSSTITEKSSSSVKRSSSSVKRSSSSRSSSSNALPLAYLWRPSAPYQVQTPELLECLASKTEEECAEETAGWWYTYGWGGTEGSEYEITPPLNETHPIEDAIGIYGLSLSFRVDNQLNAAETNIEPAGAAIGFDWRFDQTAIDMTKYGKGICIKYNANRDQILNKDAQFKLKIRWDSEEFGDDNFYYTLPNLGSSGTNSTVNIPWKSFKKDGWDKGHSSTTYSIAARNATGLEISIQNTDIVYDGAEGLFILWNLAWYDNGACY
jgi:hypothetical protein